AGAGGGQGAPATSGDATWVHRFFDTTKWTTPGGDFAGAASATTDVADVGSYHWSSPQLAADVQDSLDNASGNFGWILLAGDGAAAQRFDSRENADASVRPALTVEFSTGPVAIPLPRE